MRKLLLPILVVLLSFVGYSQDSLRITGKISDFRPTDQLFLLSDAFRGEIDVVNGNFQSTLKVPAQGGDVHLYLKKGEETVGTYFFLLNENVEINLSALNLNYSEDIAIGSPNDSLRYKRDLLVKDLFITRENITNKLYSLDSIAGSPDSINTLAIQYKQTLKALDNKIKKINYNFLQENINSNYGLFLAANLAKEYSEKYIRDLLGLLDHEHSNSATGEYLRAVADYVDLPDASTFYDFKMYNLKGELMNFSDVFNDKYVLLNLMSSFSSDMYYHAPLIGEIEQNLSDYLEVVNILLANPVELAIDTYSDLKKSPENIYYLELGELDPMLVKYGKPTLSSVYVLFSPDKKIIFYEKENSSNLSGLMQKFINEE